MNRTHKRMMFWLLTLVVTSFARPLHAAPNIHVVIVADTLDKRVGESVRHDLGYVMTAFYSHVPKNQLNIEVVADDQLNAKNVLSAIKSCKVGADDAIVFFWSGHGAYDQTGHYFHMPDGNPLYRKTVLGAMKEKKARLVVLLTDTCNKFYDALAGRPPAVARPRFPERTSPLFEHLFFDYEGVLDVNAASKDQVALAIKEGSLFTLALCYANFLTDDLPSILWKHANEQMGWKSIIKEVDAEAQRLSRKVARRRDPQRVAVSSWPNPLSRQTVWLKRGDVILSINGKPIRNEDQCVDAVNNSPRTMHLRVRDVNNGRVRYFRVQLRTEKPRFGVDVRNYSGKGAVVYRVFRGYPATRLVAIKANAGD